MSPVQFVHDVRKRGFSAAFESFKHRRHLPVVAYLILAGFTGFAFSQEREHSNQNRAQLAEQTRVTLVSGCERNNALRKTLHDIVLNGIPQVKQYVKEGTLTKAQGDRAVANARDTASKLNPIDCDKAYPKPKSD